MKKRFCAKLIEFDKVDRYGRIFPKETMEKAIEEFCKENKKIIDIRHE